MTQQIRLFLATSLVVFLGLYFGLGAGAFADDSAPVTLTGQVSFERHVRLVPYGSMSPMFCIQGEACGAQNKPQYYWALVVTSDGVRYELAQPITLGGNGTDDDRAPATYQLDGVVVHEGEDITLSGIVQTLSDDYGVISEVDSVSPDSP